MAAKQTKADESRNKMDAESRQADLERHEKNASSATQGGADDPKSRGTHVPQEARGGSHTAQEGQQQTGGQQSKQSAKSSGFQDDIAQVATAIKTLTEAGCGGQEAARIAVEIWKGK